MKKITLFLSLFALLLFPNNVLQAQCQPGQVEVTIDVATDNWGYEIYWELVPGGNNCGNGTIFAGGNAAQVGCNGGGQQNASAGGYANNTTVTEGPWCLTDGNTYDIIFIDDYADGGGTFTVNIEGYPVHVFRSVSSGDRFSFVAEAPAQYDAGVTFISTPGFVFANPTTIKGDVFNYGTDPITSLELNYSIDGGPAVTETLTGINIAPFSTLSVVHGTLWTPSNTGTYNLQVWTGNINGNLDPISSNDTLSKTLNVAPPIPNIIDNYLTQIPMFDVIGTSADQLDQPRDLDWHPDLSKRELWVINTNTEGSGGSTVKFSNAGLANQTDLWQRDGNAWHFMSLPTGIAFSDNTNFATSTGVFDANHNGGNPFTGPALWSSDPNIYAQPSGGNGSHLDMLHASPHCMGIAHEIDNAFWVYDANNNDIVRYDFVDDHGPGNSDHSDGRIVRVTGMPVQWVNDQIPSHLELDKETGWLYIADVGNARVIRMDINSGSKGGSPSFGPYETLAEYTNLNNVTWEVVADTGLSQPSGIDLIGDRMIVTDYATGDIHLYDISSMPATPLGKIETGTPGVAGITVGPEGMLWFTNALTNEVVRIEMGGVSTDPSAEQLQVSIYPNPTAGRLILNAWDHELEGHNVLVTDMMGKVVFQKVLGAGNSASLDLGLLSSGMYMLSLENQGNRLLTERISVRH